MANVICVDGPAASGKSTVSKAVAEKLGIPYYDKELVDKVAFDAGP